MNPRKNEPTPDMQDEAGIHRDREAPRKDEAQTPPRRESQSESDRTDRAETPASAPRK